MEERRMKMDCPGGYSLVVEMANEEAGGQYEVYVSLEKDGEYIMDLASVVNAHRFKNGEYHYEEGVFGVTVTNDPVELSTATYIMTFDNEGELEDISIIE